MRAAVRKTISDIRVLGSSAAVRGPYELARRVGVHDAVFGALARRTPPPSHPQVPFGWHPGGIPPAARERALSEAELIMQGRATVFDRPVPLGEDLDWFATHPEAADHWASD